MIADRHPDHSIIKRRMEVIFLLFLVGVLLLAFRLVYLQWFLTRDFARLATRMQSRTLELDALRGRIRDRSGAELAIDQPAKAIAINPQVVKDPALTANRLGELLGLDQKQRETLRERIARADARGSYYSLLRRGVNRKLALGILEKSRKEPALKGLWLEESPVRVYPAGRDAAQLIGSVSIDGKGIEAIELRFDKVLDGKDGKRRVRVAATGEAIPQTEERLLEPEDGKDVRLTIDRDIQHFVETELAKVAAEQSPEAATAVVIEVATGDVLGMANWPSFHPNDKKVTPDQRRNRAVTDWFEPGSIFKVFTAAAALEAGVNPNVYCGGSRAIGSRSVRCAHGSSHGACDLEKMIQKSCNIAAGTLAERVGPQEMYRRLDLFGFQSKTGIEFPGEVHGWMQKPEKWRTMRTVNIGFGQGIVTTPIQIAAGYAAIANDGMYMPPRLVLDAPGMEMPERKPRRVMSAENARKLVGLMRSVCESGGTGTGAKIAGYSVAGKTGTAQIARNGRYLPGAYVASFAGFIPAKQPKLAILVSVWHPRKAQYGGVVSAPVFREIARQSVTFLGIPPDAPGDLRDGANPASFYRTAKNTGGDNHD